MFREWIFLQSLGAWLFFSDIFNYLIFENTGNRKYETRKRLAHKFCIQRVPRSTPTNQRNKINTKTVSKIPKCHLKTEVEPTAETSTCRIHEVRLRQRATSNINC
jgi:hypothetical protein